jgi:hypothetical protein
MGRLEMLGSGCEARVGVAGGFLEVVRVGVASGFVKVFEGTTGFDTDDVDVDDRSYHSTLGSVGTGTEAAANDAFAFTRGGVKTTGSWDSNVVLT